jgi:hypothetical protein
VCRKMYAETRVLPFELNAFDVDMFNVRKLREVMGKDVRHSRMIELRGDVLFNLKEPGELAAFTGLKYVVTDCHSKRTAIRRVHELCGRSDIEVVSEYAWALKKGV